MGLNSGSAGFAASVAATWAGVSTVCSSRTWQVAHERPFVPANGVSKSCSPFGFLCLTAAVTAVVSGAWTGPSQAPSANSERAGTIPSARDRKRNDDTPDESVLHNM